MHNMPARNKALVTSTPAVLQWTLKGQTTAKLAQGGVTCHQQAASSPAPTCLPVVRGVFAVLARTAFASQT
jgi:hypothetical protein